MRTSGRVRRGSRVRRPVPLRCHDRDGRAGVPGVDARPSRRRHVRDDSVDHRTDGAWRRRGRIRRSGALQRRAPPRRRGRGAARTAGSVCSASEKMRRGGWCAPLEDPASDRLVVVQAARHRHVCLHVAEPGPLQGPVRPDVEGVGLADQALEPEDVEVELRRLPDTARPDARSPTVRIEDVRSKARPRSSRSGRPKATISC